MDAIGVKTREDIFLPTADLSLSTLFHRLQHIGLYRGFVTNRLLPRSLSLTLLNKDRSYAVEENVVEKRRESA